jgi:hypothetical protein
MSTNTIRRGICMSVLSLLLALVACAFLPSAGAGAHSISQARLSQTIGLSSVNLKSCPSNIVHIVFIKNFGDGFTCHAMSVKVGTPVVFVNTTATPSFKVIEYAENFFLEVKVLSRAQFFTTQPGQIFAFIYDDGIDPQTQLFITVVS